MSNRFQRLPLALAVALTVPFAHADGNLQIEEVVVTAQKRLESLQDTPVAMSAFQNHDLEAMGTVDLSGIATASPSLNFTPYPSSSSTMILFMRGQGANDAAQITKDGAVGIYVDGVYMARPQAMTMDLADVESIEVLRGPQGTLYGRNTTGGAVNVTTSKPTGEFGLTEHITIGNQGRQRSMTMVDLPEFAGVMAKVSYVRSQKDGYVDNPGGHDFGEANQEGARLALRWEPRDDLSVDYAFETGSYESTPIYYQNDLLANFVPGYSTKPHDTAYRTADLPMSDADFSGHAVTLTWDLTDDITFKSISAYRELKTEFYQDYLDAAFIAGYYKTADEIENRQWSQEFQLVGSALDYRLDYVLGLYHFEESSRHDQTLWLQDLAGDFGPGNLPMSTFRHVNADAESSAIFAQATYTPPVLEDNLSVTVGLRYTKDDRDGERDQYLSVPAFAINNMPLEQGVRNDTSTSSVDPTLTVNYQWSSDLNTYVKFATAYKSGGFAESGGDFTLDVDPEEITSYELGVKSYWLDRRVRLNLAAFMTDYDDMQLDLSPDAAQIQIVNTYNAGTATINGLEMDMLVQLAEKLRLSVDYTYLDWDIEEVLHPTTGADITASFGLPYAPQHAYHVGLDYTYDQLSLGLVDFRLDYNWQSETYLSAGISNSASTRKAWTRDDYGLLDARMTLSVDLDNGSQVRVALWGKNLEDKQYASHRFFAGAGSVVAWNEPRSYGLDLIYEY